MTFLKIQNTHILWPSNSVAKKSTPWIYLQNYATGSVLEGSLQHACDIKFQEPKRVTIKDWLNYETDM